MSLSSHIKRFQSRVLLALFLAFAILAAFGYVALRPTRTVAQEETSESAPQKLEPIFVKAYSFNGRRMEVYDHAALPRWGGEDPNQTDRIFVLYPRDGSYENRPLYVALHSAGGSAETELSWRMGKEVHNIYLVPDDFYGFFIDCHVHKDRDWWWGGRRADEPEINDENRAKSTAELQPVEKRALDEIQWMIDRYKIDANRVYLCGNSMGGSGTLGLGLRHGELFAAIKANVPAGIWHAYDRLQLAEDSPTVAFPDPPVCLDYSAPNDQWSAYHERLFEGMERRKYSYIAYWGNFGHANLDEVVAKHNDLFNTFPWTEVRKNEAYAVFTNASTDDSIPWPDSLADAPAGQRGAYFRWSARTDTETKFEIELRLASAEELKSTLFEIPTTATADVSLRRLQRFAVAPNEEIAWRYGDASGKVKADQNGLVTIPRLTVETAPKTLLLEK